MSGFVIEGLDKLVADLEKAVARAPNAKQKFLAQEAGLLKGRAMRNTPVDTGLLRGSWKQTPPSGNSVTVYDNVSYSGFVEHGHRVKIHGRFTGTFVPGRHMLRKAVDETKANFVQDGRAIMSTIFGR